MGNDDELLVEVRVGLDQMRRDLSKAREEINSLKESGGSASSSLTKDFASAGKSVAGFLGGVIAIDTALSGLGKLVSVNREFGVLNASLITATGSAQNAATAFNVLQAFAQKTPYDLKQATEAFVQLVNLGLTPSERAMTSYGDTAAAMGKDLKQMVEAVADAATGEFERLKEFGIKAKNQGDTITFTFRGVKETVRNDAASIEEYLVRLGEINFAGTMTERMKTLDGAIANLGDSWDQLFLSMGQAGASNAIGEFITGITGAINELTAEINSGQLGALFEGLSASFFGWGDDIVRGLPVISAFIKDELFGWVDVGDDTAGFLIDAFKEWPENVRAFIRIIATEMAYLAQKAEIVGTAITQNLDPTDGEWTSYKELRKQIDSLDSARQDSLKTVLDEREAAKSAAEYKVEQSKRLRDEYDKEREARAKATSDMLAGFGVGKGKGGGKGGLGGPEKPEKPIDIDVNPRIDPNKMSEWMQKDVNDQIAKQEEADKYLTAIQNKHMSEMELLDKNNAEKQEKLKEYRDQDLISEDAYNQTVQVMNEDHYAKRRTMLEEQFASELAIINMSTAMKVASSASEIDQLIGTAGQGNRKLFEIQKVARLAEAAINLPATVMSAYRTGSEIGGPVVGAAYGAIALSAQLVNLRNIQSATFGGGQGGASAGSGSAGSASVSSGGSGGRQEQQKPTRYVQIGLQGEENSMYSKNAIRKLIERIGEEVKDGAILGVN